MFNKKSEKYKTHNFFFAIKLKKLNKCFASYVLCRIILHLFSPQLNANLNRGKSDIILFNNKKKQVLNVFSLVLLTTFDFFNKIKMNKLTFKM